MIPSNFTNYTLYNIIPTSNDYALRKLSLHQNDPLVTTYLNYVLYNDFNDYYLLVIISRLVFYFFPMIHSLVPRVH